MIDKWLRRDAGDPKAEHMDGSASDPNAATIVSEETTLAYNIRVFEQYNARKLEFLYELLPPRKRTVFDLIPYLIHVDGAELLGCEDACQMSPHGVYGFEMTPQIEDSLNLAFPGSSPTKVRARASFDPTLPIKSISLIGSLGSIAQNAKSDFDYWICYEEKEFSRESFIYFQEKLQAIEEWADAFAGAEVHFFPLELDKVRVNDFGAAGGESSGSALGKLLKEEFYRTMTMVAGQVPLWWAMPPGVTDDDYTRLADLIRRSGRLDGNRLVDMGNVFDISQGEFYGAAIWQINKTMGSPFKSILKMALLEEYMVNHGRKGLLCDDLKRRLISNQEEIDFLDPYVLMFERASDYLKEEGLLNELDLLRRSLYMKSGASLALPDYRNTDLPRKKRVMVRLVRQWNWNHKIVARLNNFHNWSFRESQTFSKETNAFIIRTYRNVSRELNARRDEVGLAISQRDLTVLGRKLFIHYSRRTNKVESIKSVIEAPPALDGLTIQPHVDEEGELHWVAYRALLSRHNISRGMGEHTMLLKSADLAKVLVWLVTNQLYSSRTSINLNAQANMEIHCTVPDLQTLLRELQAFFPTYRHNDIDEEALLVKPTIVRMFLVVNLEEPDWARNIEHTGICYQNNWGEVFYRGFHGNQDGMKVARDFVRRTYAYDPLSAMQHFKVYLPEREFKREFQQRLEKFFGMKVVI